MFQLYQITLNEILFSQNSSEPRGGVWGVQEGKGPGNSKDSKREQNHPPEQKARGEFPVSNTYDWL